MDDLLSIPLVLLVVVAVAVLALPFVSVWALYQALRGRRSFVDGVKHVYSYFPNRTGGRLSPFETRVERTAAALTEAGTLVGELQREIAERTAAVQRLEQQQQALDLTTDQLEAVSLLLSEDSHRESRRALWYGIASNAVFFLLGVGVTVWLG